VNNYIPLIVIGIYLAVVVYISIFAFRKGKSNSEDFFLASRTIGSMVFFLSLFATNMTAFAILGSSGMAYKQGIGVFGLMASSSGFVIPMTLFFIGTRLWALGKKFGHMTQVQYFRDRWECADIGTVIFALSVAMLIPYMIISIMGGGRVLLEISGGVVNKWQGCLIVAVTVTVIVFFGGMRGTVWVNIFQEKKFAYPRRPGDEPVVFLELHAGAFVVDHVSAHVNHVPLRAQSLSLPPHGGGVPHRDHADLAALRVPGGDRLAIDRLERQRDRRNPPCHAHQVRPSSAGGHPRSGHYFGRDGFRLPSNPGGQHHVYERRLGLLWRR
jgi:hypothetical protein